MYLFAVTFKGNLWTLRSIHKGKMREESFSEYSGLENALKNLIRTEISLDPPGAKRPVRAFTPELFSSHVRGKRVAIVCNAAYMEGSGHGKEIDSYDLIIRLSFAAGAHLPPEDQGSRTDLWCLNSSSYRKLLSGALRYPPGEAPILHVRSLASFTPAGHYADVPHPTTGALMRTHAVLGSILVHQALLGGAGEVFVTGMDFFRSTDPFVQAKGRTSTHHIHASGTVCHHFPTDERFMRHLREEYPGRLKTDPYLGEILDGKHPRE